MLGSGWNPVRMGLWKVFGLEAAWENVETKMRTNKTKKRIPRRKTDLLKKMRASIIGREKGKVIPKEGRRETA